MFTSGLIMQRIFRLCLALGMAFWLVGNVAAQQKSPPLQPADFTQINLLQNPSVQKELKLSADQIGKLKEIFAEHQEGIKEVWQKYPPQEAGQHWQEMTGELKKGAVTVLDEKQRYRFWQIDFQQITSFGNDSTTYARPDVVTRLGITAEQKKQLQAIQIETGNKTREAIKTPNLYQQKIAAAKKEDREQVAALLTKDQQQQWQELIGARFTVTNAQVDLQTALRQWIRDDVAAAQAQSRQTGKPIFVICRCEP